MVVTSALDRPGPVPERTTAYGDHPDQLLELWPGDPERPLIVLAHGGFWRSAFDRTHLRPMAAALRAGGGTVVSLEYRRSPGDPDASASDLLAGLRAAREHGGPVVLVGHSAGGHLGLYAAVTEPRLVDRLVALAPVADLGLADRWNLGGGAVREYLGGPADGRPDLDPVALDTPRVPVTILHGDADERVPLGISESYVDRNPDVGLVEIAGADHFALIDPLSEAWPRVLAEIAAA